MAGWVRSGTDLSGWWRLQVQEDGLARGYRDITAGDCVVAFSRKAIYEIKSFIESSTGMRQALSACTPQHDKNLQLNIPLCQ